MPSIRQLAKIMEPLCCYTGVLLTGVSRSSEHVVPLCRISNKLARMDLINVYACDLALNIQRSAYKFEDGPDELLIDHKTKVFTPSNRSKGLIARTCLHMQETYDVDLTKVIDQCVLESWLELEMTDYEKRHLAFVEMFQPQLVPKM
jgi:endonuclease I